ncbi:MAG: hypothetical protein AMS21_11080 [Gemmatimonas sp. SG8_38_2]|nr:MAG: hypothetical protein AMS21_11080 [Gemmatimonas sp. SG8_38_2]
MSPGNAENGWRAAVQPVELLADSGLIRPLLSGLPLRFHFQIELWHDKFVADALQQRATWSLILYQEPLSGDFSLTRSWDPDRPEWFATLAAAAQALERVYLSPLAGPQPNSGRYYYDARLEVEALSLGDLDELEHWLRGEVLDENASSGGGLAQALGRGVKRLFIRLIGLSARKYEARTELFRS